MNSTLVSTKKDLVVVGIGASAGGLEALRRIFSKIDEAPTACFVVVQHMSPTSKSMLAELLSRETKLKVKEAEDKETLKSGVVYVAPPNADILIEACNIKLTELKNRLGPKPSVDRFLISLADSYGENAIACILSGTGSDGSQGVMAVKAAGGVTISQSAKSAKYDGMPRSAIQTGAIDLIIDLEEIARELQNISFRLSKHQDGILELYPEDPYQGILELLSRKTKVDFRLYKSKTITRRLERRVNAVKEKNLEGYYQYLKRHPKEVQNLFYDVLISVTSFFRDSSEFEELKRRFKDYILQNSSKTSLRMWSAGCATGEEAYSLAIMALEIIVELRGEVNSNFEISVFATDISEEAMVLARKGVFPLAAVEGMNSHILERYFSKVQNGYQIKKEVRDRVLFARHDLTVDPPFLKMDIICCRNVFIYFEHAIQDKIIKIFHYALNQNGILFLGKSESLGKKKSYFRSLEDTAKIFERLERSPDPTISFAKLEEPEQRYLKGANSVFTRSQSVFVEADIIRNFCPNALVLDEDMRLTAVYGDAEKYIKFPNGSMDQNKIDGLINPAIKSSVIALVHRCKRSNQPIGSGPLALEIKDKIIYLEIRAYYIETLGLPKVVLGFMVIKSDDLSVQSRRSQSLSEIEILERELMATREHLQTVIEEQENSNEELQALNEELQSANEELQSTNEELETSNEELQSTNEELITVNEELNIKSAELAELSSHLQIVQDAVKSPIMVLDSNFNLIRFNNSASQLLHLNNSHLSKNFRLAASKIDLEPLFDLFEECLLSKKSRESHFKNRFHDFDVFCHFISDDKCGVEGAVITLVDNSELSTALDQAKNSRSLLFNILKALPAKVSVKNEDGRYTFVNPTFCDVVGFNQEDIIGKTDVDLFGEVVGEERRRRDFDALQKRKAVYWDETHPSSAKEDIIFHTARLPLADEKGNIDSICSVGIDISGRVYDERKLRQFQHVIARAEDCFAVLEKEGSDYLVSFGSETLCDLCEFSSSELEGKSILEILRCIGPTIPKSMLKEYQEKISSQKRGFLEFAGGSADENRYFEIRSYRPDDNGGSKIFLTIIDVTAEKTRNDQVKKQEEEYERAAKLAALGEMAAGIAHELKTPLNTIQCYVDLIGEYQEQEMVVADPIKEAIRNIESTVTNISEIIVGLKSIANASSDEGFVECNVDSIVEDVTRICAFHFKHKGVSLNIDISAPGATFIAKPTQIVQVLINLLNNAVDAVSDKLDSWVSLEVGEREGKVEFSVIDSGKGIPLSVSGQIMTPFLTTKKTGTGLGLSLSRNIAKLHNGSLEVDSGRKNTCFVMKIPKDQQEANV